MGYFTGYKPAVTLGALIVGFHWLWLEINERYVPEEERKTLPFMKLLSFSKTKKNTESEPSK